MLDPARAVLFAAAIALASSSGCVVPALRTVDHNVRFDRTSPDAIVVFGFSAKLNVWLFEGVDDGVNWHCVRGAVNARRFRPEDGFVVASLRARTGKEKYAIGALGTDMNIEVHAVRENSGVWVFNAAPGKVTYVGALRVAWSGGRPSILDDASVTASHADDFVTRTFPNITDHVVTGRMEEIYMDNDGCLPTPLLQN
jgi:hypothetical protein